MSTTKQNDPYASLDAHIGKVRGLYCEDGCGLIETSGASIDDRDAATDLARRGWVVRPHSMGGLTALCSACAQRHDVDHPSAAPADHAAGDEMGGAS